MKKGLNKKGNTRVVVLTLFRGRNQDFMISWQANFSKFNDRLIWRNQSIEWKYWEVLKIFLIFSYYHYLSISKYSSKINTCTFQYNIYFFYNYICQSYNSITIIPTHLCEFFIKTFIVHNIEYIKTWFLLQKWLHFNCIYTFLSFSSLYLFI